MSEKYEYKTVRKYARETIIEKKSRFIATVYPVTDEEDAIEKLNSIKKEYPDATHNVYAYVIDKTNTFRYSDDGEPSGTAGMPVLDVIRKEGIVDVLVVVTRYFGGTLLGTGGLVHAYGSSAKEGLYAADIVTRTLCDEVHIKTDYGYSGKLIHEIESSGYIQEDTVYSDAVEFIILSKISETEKIVKDFTDMTNGTAEITVTGRKYVYL